MIGRKSLPTAATGFAAAVVLSFTTPEAAKWEGLRLDPYLDIVGVPTVCFGDTTVEMRSYTREECEAMLTDRLGQFGSRLNACVSAPELLPVKVRVAVLNWSYNVGTGAACKSTLVKLLNKGDLEGACNQLPRWNKAGGKPVRGLTRRRADEQRICLEGVGEGLTAPAPPAPSWLPKWLARVLGYSVAA